MRRAYGMEPRYGSVWVAEAVMSGGWEKEGIYD